MVTAGGILGGGEMGAHGSALDGGLEVDVRKVIVAGSGFDAQAAEGLWLRLDLIDGLVDRLTD